MIPKKIYTVWLSETGTMPELVQRCIASQQIPGYEHYIIDLHNCHRNKYIQDAIDAKQWGKACDYLRCWYLIQEGGIYLDADVQILPNKNFDSLLEKEIFASRENNGFVNTAVLGAQKGCQLLIDHLAEVEQKFTGNDGKYFESSIELITPRLLKEATVLPPETFYPYDHQRNTVDIKNFTITYHYFLRSWL